MRLLKSTPKDRAFYNEHGGNLSAYYTIANIGQLLSAGSLALAVFTLLSDAIKGRGMSTSTAGVVVAAVLIGVFIELANRKLARPAIRPWVVKDQFTEDPDKRKRHKLLTKFSRAGLVTVGLLSFGLSFMGSLDAGQLITDDAPPANIDSLQIAFAADTSALLAPYTIRSRAAADGFAATRANREKIAQDFAGCARKGNGWCKKRERTILAEIDAARADYNATSAAIATGRGQALADALQRRDATYAGARSDATAAADELAADAQGNGYIFAVLTFAGQVVFYLMFYLILQIEAGSEIADEIEPNEFHALPSVWADFKATLSHRVERGARRLIAYIFGKRERLEDGLPYVSLWSDVTVSQQQDATSIATAHTNAAPGYYRKADDPHTPKPRAPFNAPNTHGTHENNETPTHESPEAKAVYSRLMQYKQRLGTQEQKAKVQERKDGKVKPRTVQAIANNQQWVSHYEQLLNDLTNG
jgi:hypothetical protein